MRANAIRDLLIERMNALDEHNVYRSERFIKDERTLKTQFLHDDRITGSWMRRVKRTDKERFTFGNTFTTWRVFLIEGFSESTASEERLDARIDAVIDAFVDTPQLSAGLHVHQGDEAGIELIEQAPFMLGGYLLHLATLEIRLFDESN